MIINYLNGFDSAYELLSLSSLAHNYSYLVIFSLSFIFCIIPHFHSFRWRFVFVSFRCVFVIFIHYEVKYFLSVILLFLLFRISTWSDPICAWIAAWVCNALFRHTKIKQQNINVNILKEWRMRAHSTYVDRLYVERNGVRQVNFRPLFESQSDNKIALMNMCNVNNKKKERKGERERRTKHSPPSKST